MSKAGALERRDGRGKPRRAGRSRKRTRRFATFGLSGLALLCGIGLDPETLLAGPEHLGRFYPVAAEESGRALWINPAAVGVSVTPATVAEIVWFVDDNEGSGRLFAEGVVGDSLAPASSRKGLRFYNLAVSTGRSSLGFQWEFDDADGIADWTLAWSRPARLGQNLVLGSTLEWRAGSEGKLEASFALRSTLGSSITAAVVGRNVFESDVDGRKSERLWQSGISLRSAKAMGRLAYDVVILEESEDLDHWFSAALDRVKRVRLEYARNTRDEWSASADLVSEGVLLGVGIAGIEGDVLRLSLSAEWRGRPLDPRRGRPRR
jgi:hypothetical protein